MLKNKADADLIAEAGTVYHETSLTPRQLLERVKELEAHFDKLLNPPRGTFLDFDDWITDARKLAKHGVV